MNINELINQALAKYSMEGHPQPSALYLGTREESLLLKEIEKMPKLATQMASYPPRPKWNGLSVYRVNETSHIAFS
jgi:hypothetical protein